MKKLITGLSLVALLSCTAGYAAPKYFKCDSSVAPSKCYIQVKSSDGSTYSLTVAAGSYITHSGETPKSVEFNIQDAQGNTINSSPGNRCEPISPYAEYVAGEKTSSGQVRCKVVEAPEKGQPEKYVPSSK